LGPWYPARRLGAALAPLLTAVVLAGCYPTAAARPSGSGRRRYRDRVFSSYLVTRDITYGEAPDIQGHPVTLRLDLYQPKGDHLAQRPILIWAHGGGFEYGTNREGISPTIGAAFARRGYVVATIDYRMSSAELCGGEVTADCSTKVALEAIQDGQTAVRWARANAARYRLDPDRVAAGGESAGGMMAAGAGLMSDQPGVGVGSNPGESSKVEAWVSISAGFPGGQMVDAHDAPGELINGSADPNVPWVWADQTAHAMQAAHVPVVLHTYWGAGHLPYQYLTDMLHQITYFLYDHLDLAKAPS
ncbi:MAG TPA: alpha/beta hydrolase, partial [Acidimicrobiales bacterium]